ncbi:uncharacterized protein LOC131433816 [Malaya genurostris]|uniref:uncharacterized protein LOC131433816 n=1 Tax=Malaya genurostris TaxID=325434 RepID=UPI0026F3F1EB|nr:uncharacterized protein LOC131433816 [Malaya genurostris]
MDSEKVEIIIDDIIADEGLISVVQLRGTCIFKTANSVSVTTGLLEDILVRNEIGKIVCKYYKSHQYLDNVNRRALSHTVVDYYIAKFAKLISLRFPPEIAETYYNPRDISANKKHPSGLLYDRFHNRSKKDLGKRIRDKVADHMSNVKSSALELPDKEIERLSTVKNWLRNNIAPEERIRQHWAESFLLRFRNIQQDKNSDKRTILNDWPRITDENGYLLIDTDFNHLYNTSERLETVFDCWEKFAVDFIDYARISNIKDHYSIQLLDTLSESYILISQDTRDYILCTIFHAIVKPSRTSARKLPTIVQAQNDVCCIIDTYEEYREALISLRKEHESANIQLSPRIYAIGHTQSLDSFYVVTQFLEYKLPTFLRCLDVVVKLKFVLDFEFPESCELFWCFICQFFYDINSSRKSKNSQLLQLLAFLKARQK